MKKTNFYFLFFLAGTLLFHSCQDDDEQVITTSETAEYSSDVVLDWVELTLKLTEETDGFTPPVAARVYGYSGLALYESVRHGMPGYRSLEGQLSSFSSVTFPSFSDDS